MRRRMVIVPRRIGVTSWVFDLTSIPGDKYRLSDDMESFCYVRLRSMPLPDIDGLRDRPPGMADPIEDCPPYRFLITGKKNDVTQKEVIFGSGIEAYTCA